MHAETKLLLLFPPSCACSSLLTHLISFVSFFSLKTIISFDITSQYSPNQPPCEVSPRPILMPKLSGGKFSMPKVCGVRAGGHTSALLVQGDLADTVYTFGEGHRVRLYIFYMVHLY